MLNATQARDFFSAWKRLHPETPTISQWHQFFEDWNDLGEALPAPTPKPVSLDCGAFRSFSETFLSAYRRYLSSGAMTNVWQVASINHDELRNSKVLAWMLDCHQDHGQGSVILEALVNRVLQKKKNAAYEQQEWAARLRKHDYRTRTESNPLGELENRIDIEIESPSFLIFIEVKVNAGESGKQLDVYPEILEKKSAGRPTLMIYLTLTGKGPNNGDPSIVPISWREIAQTVSAHASGSARGTISGYLFQQFANHIRLLK